MKHCLMTRQRVGGPIPRGLLGVALGLLVLAGCGESGFPHAPVAGTVQINGEPVEGVRVLFQPKSKSDSGEAGGMSFAVTDSSGHFELAMTDGRRGAVVGEHRLVFRMFRKNKRGEPSMNEGLPSRFNSASTMTFQVPRGGTTNADFQLDASEIKLSQLWQAQDTESASSRGEFADDNQ